MNEKGQFPLRQFIGMAMEDISPGKANARLEVNERLLNPNGVVHGGVMFTMIDTAMGRATMSTVGESEHCASIEVQVRFLRPVVAGTLLASASVIKRGRRIVHLEATVQDGDGVLAATGTGTFAILEAGT